MVPFLLLLGAIALYLVGYLNGRAERDHKACELLAEERHQRILAEEALKATCEHANAALFRADLHVQSLRRAEDAYRELLQRMHRESQPVMFPQKPEPEPIKVLTPEAEAARAEFEAYYGDGNCSCHINPPCGSCTHPGNPMNQAEDESCWEVANG